jgi:hypothetical protein
LWPAARIKHKTHDRCQPWVFVKSFRLTSANGVGDDYHDDCQIDGW